MKNKILSNKIKIISIISITLLLFVTIPGKASNKKEVSYREYFVLKGDTVWSIASRFKTEKMDIRDYMYEIEKTNEIKNSKIYENNKLIIPKYNEW